MKTKPDLRVQRMSDIIDMWRDNKLEAWEVETKVWNILAERQPHDTEEFYLDNDE